MNLPAPIPLSDALSAQAVKAILPTQLRTNLIATAPVQLRERALWSSGITSGELLQKVQDGIKGVVGGAKTEEQVKSEIARLVDLLSEQGISRNPRVSLVVDTQVDMARGYGYWRQAQDPAVLDEYPAWELVRAEDRDEPRDWPARWAAAGGKFYPGSADYPDGRMIALKDDPIWTEISRFGLPYAPFDYNSGMDLDDVSRSEAQQLGLIDPDETVDPQTRGFNEDLESSPLIHDASILASLESFFGGLARFGPDGVLRFKGNEGRAAA